MLGWRPRGIGACMAVGGRNNQALKCFFSRAIIATLNQVVAEVNKVTYLTKNGIVVQ